MKAASLAVTGLILLGVVPAFADTTVIVINGTILPAPLSIVLTPPLPAPVPCNAPTGTVIQTASYTGGDGNTVTWTLSGNADFVIGLTSGVISVAPGGIPPADCNKPFSYSITASQT